MKKEKRYRFSTIAAVARIGMSRLGWRDSTAQQLHEIGRKPANWTIADQGNLHRVADALESIARELKKLSKTTENEMNRRTATCNESQGSEWDKVLVVEDSAAWDMRRWRYTAVTRAAKELIYCI